MMTTRLLMPAALLLGSVLAFVAGPVWAANGTTGRNVTFVGSQQSDFEMKANRRWVERSKTGNGTFNFIEQNRDDWSVYLMDQSRGVRLQLDLHRREIFYSDGNNPNRRLLYRISNSNHTVKGWNARVVNYPGGFFQMAGNGRWLESNRDGRHNFQEQNRDEWSVYLLDPSRGVTIQLDLHRKEIFYADRNNPNRRVLYRISSVSAL